MQISIVSRKKLELQGEKEDNLGLLGLSDACPWNKPAVVPRSTETKKFMFMCLFLA